MAWSQEGLGIGWLLRCLEQLPEPVDRLRGANLAEAFPTKATER